MRRQPELPKAHKGHMRGSKERCSQKLRVADSSPKANEGPPKTDHDQPFGAERPKAGQRKEQRSTPVVVPARRGARCS
jgi:hypothetical protein